MPAIVSFCRLVNSLTSQSSSWWIAAGVLATLAAVEASHGKPLCGPEDTEWPPVEAMEDTLLRYRRLKDYYDLGFWRLLTSVSMQTIFGNKPPDNNYARWAVTCIRRNAIRSNQVVFYYVNCFFDDRLEPTSCEISKRNKITFYIMNLVLFSYLLLLS